MSRQAIAISMVAIASLFATGACSTGDPSSPPSSSSSGTCPDDVPAACPSKAPTYAKDVAPAIQAACTPCHAPGGRASDRILVDYANAFRQRGGMLSQIHSCRMPPPDAPPLSAEARAILLAWLVCGAPNN